MKTEARFTAPLCKPLAQLSVPEVTARRDSDRDRDNGFEEDDEEEARGVRGGNTKLGVEKEVSIPEGED